MRKIKSNILFICLITILAGSSCGKSQFNPVMEQTPHPTTLSSMLLRPSDLSENWKWTHSIVMQDLVTPSPNNNQDTGRIGSSLSGSLFHNEKKYLFMIYHSVEVYDPSIPYVESPAYTVGASPVPFSIHLVEVGDEMKFICSKDNHPSDPIFFCGILIKYKRIESILRITGEANAGEPLIEEVVNQMLTAIDVRIRANQ